MRIGLFGYSWAIAAKARTTVNDNELIIADTRIDISIALRRCEL
jgi:hypothetical protein